MSPTGLAAYGLPVEFAAVSGDPDSDLTEDVMQSLRIPRLLTGNTFQITFVRTLHGLELKDLGSMARYLAELSRMNTTSRQRVILTEAAQAEFYNQQGSDSAPRNSWSVIARKQRIRPSRPHPRALGEGESGSAAVSPALTK